MKPRCLITGASGLLGRAMVASHAGCYEVVAVSHRSAGAALRPADLREPGQVLGLLRDVRPAVVIHCAAYRDPDFCEENPEETRRLNVEPVRLMAESMPSGAALVLISTDYVFDGDSPPYREESPVRPLSVYGSSKAEAERFVLARPRGLVVRVPLLMGAGPGPGPTGFIAQLVEAVMSGKPVSLDNVLIRFPTWTRDVAGAVKYLLERRAAGVFHASSPRGGTRYAFTVEMAGILGRGAAHLAPSETVVPRRAVRPRNAELATGKIRALGYDRLTDFAAAAQAILDEAGTDRPARG